MPIVGGSWRRVLSACLSSGSPAGVVPPPGLAGSGKSWIQLIDFLRCNAEG
jgi:hypothetical protein